MPITNSDVIQAVNPVLRRIKNIVILSNWSYTVTSPRPIVKVYVSLLCHLNASTPYSIYPQGIFFNRLSLLSHNSPEESSRRLLVERSSCWFPKKSTFSSRHHNPAHWRLVSTPPTPIAYIYWSNITYSPSMSLPTLAQYWPLNNTHRSLSDLAAGVAILSTGFVSCRCATLGCQLSHPYFRCLIWSFATVSPSPSSPVSYFFSSSRCSFQNPFPTPDDHSTARFHSPLPPILVLYYFSRSHIASRLSILSPSALGQYSPKSQSGGRHISAQEGIHTVTINIYTIFMAMF